jgi:hypothetical protein
MHIQYVRCVEKERKNACVMGTMVIRRAIIYPMMLIAIGK